MINLVRRNSNKKQDSEQISESVSRNEALDPVEELKTINPKDRTLKQQIDFEQWVLDLIYTPQKKQNAIVELARKNNNAVGLEPGRDTIYWTEPVEHSRLTRWENEVINHQSGRFFQINALKTAGLIPLDNVGLKEGRIYPTLTLVRIVKYVLSDKSEWYDPTFEAIGLNRVAQERKVVINPHRYFAPRVTYRLVPADREIKNGKQIRIAEVGMNDGVEPWHNMKLLRKWDDEEVKRDIAAFSNGKKVGEKGHRKDSIGLNLKMPATDPFSVTYEELFKDPFEVYKEKSEPKGVSIDKELLQELNTKHQHEMAHYA